MHRLAAVLIALLGLTVVAQAGTISYADAVTTLASKVLRKLQESDGSK